MDLDDQLADFRELYRREAWRQLLELTQDQQRVQVALAECQAQQQALNQQLLAAQRAPPQVVTIVPPELQAQVTSLQSQLAQAQGLYQQAQTRLAQVEAQSAATPAELASLRNQYNQAVASLNQAQGELASLKQRYDAAQATINDAIPKLEQLQATQGQYQAVAGQAQAQLQAQIQELQRQNAMLQNAQTQVNQQILLAQREAQLCRENQATQENEFKTTLQSLQMRLGQPCGLTDTQEEAAVCYQNLAQRYPNLISAPVAPQGMVTEEECRQRGPEWRYNSDSGVCSRPPAMPRPVPRQQCQPGYYYSNIQNQCIPQVVPQQPGVPLAPPVFIQETPTQISCRQMNGIYDPVSDSCAARPPPLAPEVFEPQVAPGAAQQVALHQQHQMECEAAHPEAPQDYYYNELTHQCGHIPTCPENYRYNPELNMCSSNLPPNEQPTRTVAPIPYEAVVIPPAPGFEAPPLGPGFEAPPLGPGFEALPLSPVATAPAVQPCPPNQRWSPAIKRCVSTSTVQLAAPALVDPLQLIRARENCQRQEPPQAYNVATRQCVPPPQCGPGQSYNFGAGRCIGGFAPQAPQPVKPAGGLQGILAGAMARRGQFIREPSIAERPGFERVESFA